MGFEIIDRSAKRLEEPPANRDLASDAPTVVIIPGFMTSTLASGRRTVWPSIPALSAGLGHVSRSKSLTVTGVHEIYRPLSDALAGSFRVELFGYDWRESLQEAAGYLADTISKLDPANQIHVVAHSAGCLVTLLALHANPALAKQLRQADGRIVFLGPLIGGTWTALQHATASSHLSRLLQLVDPTKSDVQIAQVLQGYESLLACHRLQLFEGSSTMKAPDHE